MKRGKIILTLFVLTIFLTNFISALSLYEGIQEVGSNIIQLLTPAFQFFLGDVSGGLFLTKTLIFIIILSLVWIGMDKSKFLDKYPILVKVLTFAVTILAMKGIGSSETINTILLPYTATGVALSSGLPFLIYFFLINKGLETQPAILRRTAWIFFAVIFFGLLAARIGGIGNLLIPSTWGVYWIYMMTSFIALAMAFLDGTIKNFFLKVEAKRLTDINKTKILAQILERKRTYDQAKNDLTDKEYEALMKSIRDDLRRNGIKRRI